MRHVAFKMTSPIAKYLEKIETYGINHTEFLHQTERQLKWHQEQMS
jgi:hypothetical protein